MNADEWLLIRSSHFLQRCNKKEKERNAFFSPKAQDFLFCALAHSNCSYVPPSSHIVNTHVKTGGSSTLFIYRRRSAVSAALHDMEAIRSGRSGRY